jgi:hypothetical protein
MQILIIFLLMAQTALNLSCKQAGPLSPDEAYTAVRSAFLADDARSIVAILSKDTKRKIYKGIRLIEGMDEKQKKALSERYGFPIDRMKKMGFTDYISLSLKIEGESGYVKKALSHELISVDREGSTAFARMANGMELTFVREGPYWKFDWNRDR